MATTIVLFCLGVFLIVFFRRKAVLDAQKEKARFLGHLTHEIKTPITSLTIALSMLERTGYDAELIQVANRDVKRLRILLENLMHKRESNNETHPAG